MASFREYSPLYSTNYLNNDQMVEKMTSDYLSYKQRQMEDINTVEIYGVPLENRDPSGIPTNGNQKRIPIKPCRCVTNPCNCGDFGFYDLIIWITIDKIIGHEKTDNKDKDDNIIYKYKIES